MFKSIIFTTFAAFLIVGVAFDADARRFGGGFKFSSAKSYKAPSWGKFGKSGSKASTTNRARTSTASGTNRPGSFGGTTRGASSTRASARSATGSRFARAPTNNFKSTRQQNAYKNYQTNQQSKFQGQAKATGSASAASSSPLYKNASRNAGGNRGDYWQRRDGFYGGWNTPGYVYGGAPRYGMFDGLFLGYMLGHAMTPSYSRFAYHHQNDPGMKSWMEEMETRAVEDAEIRAQLNSLKAEMARLQGTPIDPSYLPIGVDPDLVMAPEIVKTLKPTFRLCSATTDGNYAKFAEIVREQAENGVIVEVINTNGSMQNLEYLQSSKCDGAYVQRNAFVIYAERNPSGTYNFERLATPAVEYAHMICNRDSGIEDVGDLLGKTLLIDKLGSGTEVTWTDFVTMDSNYNAVGTERIGGAVALNQVATGQSECMMFVASLNTQLLQRANNMGDQVVLVPVNDWDFNDKEYGNGKLFQGHTDPSGEDVYVFVDIPSDQYDNIQDGLIFSSVETLSVPVDMVADLTWGKEHPEAYEALIGAVQDAQPGIDSVTRPN